MLELGVGSLVMAQVLGFVGLRRPGYELLVSLAMLFLAVIPFTVVLFQVFSYTG